jgi:hypothetical protein
MKSASAMLSYLSKKAPNQSVGHAITPPNKKKMTAPAQIGRGEPNLRLAFSKTASQGSWCTVHYAHAVSLMR